MKCTFWGSRVETVRRNSLVPRCPPWACCHRGRETVVRRWWGSSVKCTFWGSRVETVRRSSLVPRCPPWACQRRLLPLPVFVTLIFGCFLVQAGNFILYGVCKFICLSSFMYNRFHKELRFFFSLLKRKKEAKKEKSSHSTCTVRFQYHPKITQETVTIDSHQQNSPGGAYRLLLPP